MKFRRWHILIIAIVLIWLLTFSVSKIITSSQILAEDEIAIINIEGELSTLQQYPFSLQPPTSSVINNLDKASKNNNIKAIILVINSPGGTVIASKEIADFIAGIDKPVISVIREIGTSGAYWIASSSDLIIADELSITGSIGVTSSYLEFSGLMDKLGVNYEQLSVGEYKELGNPFQQLTLEEKAILDSKLQLIHAAFLKKIQEKRTIKNIEKVKTGEFFLGSEALELGLVDKLGNLDTAVQEAKALAGIKEARLVIMEEQKDTLSLLSLFSSQSSYFIGRGIGAELKQPSFSSVRFS